MTVQRPSVPPRRRRRPSPGNRPATGAVPVPRRRTIEAVSAIPEPAPVPTGPVPSFAALGVPAPLIRALAGTDVTEPFPIQAATLRDSLAGRDVLGRGRTGSGKTVAFAVPTVAALAASDLPRRPGRPRGLILVPTRELANQVAATVGPLARSMGLDVATVYGGVSQVPQVKNLRKGIEIVVACPGRLEDLMAQGECHLGAVEVCVLDEADHLADLGFLPAVRRILDQIPPGGQRLLFSATLDNGIDGLVRRYLVEPVNHSVDAIDAPPPELDHHCFTVTAGDKAQVVRELASGAERSLLFTRTKHAARKLARQLTSHGLPAVELHGNLSQAQRDRNLAAFSAGSVRVLVATDIAARGIHVDDVALVVHVDPPSEHKAYLHRSGRTARAGAAGTVVTLATPGAQQAEVAALVRRAGIRPTTGSVTPGDTRTVGLTGPPVALRPPAAVTVGASPASPRPGGARPSPGRARQARSRRRPPPR